MNIVTYLPWIAIALAVIAFFVRDLSPREPKQERSQTAALPYSLLAALVAGLVALAFAFQNSRPEGVGAAIGFAVGALAVSVSYAFGLLSIQSGAGRVMPIALGVSAVSLLPLLPFDPSPLATVFGASAAAWLLSFGQVEEPNPWGVRTALTTAAIAVINLIAAYAQKDIPDATHSGTMLGIIAIIATLIACSWNNQTGRAAIASLVFTLGAWAVGEKVLMIPDLRYLAGGACILAMIVHFMISDDQAPNTLRMIVSQVLWVTAGTAAFGIEQGYGMAVVLLAASTVLISSNNRSALLSLGPLGGLVFYRLFREEHLNATRAFEIGQHYAMVGILIGLVLPLLAQEWLRYSAGKTKFFGGIAGVLWIPALVSVPLATAVWLGSKGVVGYLFGLGLASVAASARGERSAHTLTLGLGLSALMTLSFAWLEPYLDLAKDEKLRTLGYIAGGIFILAIAIAVLSGEFQRSKKEGPATTS